MSVVASRPWTPHDELRLQQLAAAGKHAAEIAGELNRSESAVRSRAKVLNVKIAKMHGKRGPRHNGSKGTWYVSFQSNKLVRERTHVIRGTKTFANERAAKVFATAKLAEGSSVNAGTLNPHLPKRTIASRQLLSWLNEPKGAIADGQSDNEAKGKQ
jgi:hypothetical protein